MNSGEGESSIPPITKDLLVDYAGWEVLKEGTALADRSAVTDYEWTGSGLKGEVFAGGRKLYPTLQWKRGRLEDFSCQCMSARRGIFCGHLVALLQVAGSEKKPTEEKVATSDTETVSLPEPPPLRGLRISMEKGLPLQLHIRVAPNWESTLPQNKVMVMLEVEHREGKREILDQLDRGRAYQLPKPAAWVLQWIEEWCQGKFHGMLQLTRERLALWIQGTAGQPGVSWSFADGRPIEVQDLFWGKVLQEETTPVGSGVVLERRPSLARPDQDPAVSRVEKTKKEPVRAGLEGSRNYLSVQLTPVTPHWREWAGQEGLTWEPSNQRFWLRDPRQVIPFLARNWARLKEQTDLTEAPHFLSVFGQCAVARIRARVAVNGGEQGIQFELVDEQGELVPYEIDWNLGSLKIPEEEELRWILDSSSWERAKRLREGLQVEGGMTIRVKPNEEAYWANEFAREGVTLEVPENWKDRTEALLNFSRLSPAPVPQALEEQLRLYQKIGVAWLVHLFRQGLSGILADEMGLGKTVQTIALLEACRQDAELPAAPWLVVCPASLVENWIREVRRFAPQIRIGDLRKDSLQQNGVDLWIASYHRIARWVDELQGIPFGVIVADEAQHVKNPDTRNAEALRRLQSERRLMLTGTPLENRMEDLVSLFRFLMPGYLKVPGKEYSTETRKAWLAQVPARVAPYILRRTKGQVLNELPERLDQTLFAEMTVRQRQLYDRLELQAGSEIKAWQEGGLSKSHQMKVLALLTRLRQASVEPRTLEKDWTLQDSAKAVLFAEIVEEALDSGSRLLVFSQFVSVLEIWRRDLAGQGIPSCFLHGGVKDRMKEVDRFQNDPQIPVFFLSLKVGGVGLNLTGANKVLLVDPWWNPAVEEQAVSRAHRMGQKRSVHNLKMIASGTVEERVLALQQEKQVLLESLWETSEQQLDSRTLLERVGELF